MSKALHIRFEGFTACYKAPLINSGFHQTLPTPTYSNILGMLGACCGRDLTEEEILKTRIGFLFKSNGPYKDIENIDRFQYSVKKGLTAHKEGKGVLFKQFLIDPVLDVFITNTDLKPFIEKPIITPCLGRSQDICWIKFIEEVELHPVTNGVIYGSLIPIEEGLGKIPGIMTNLAEYYVNDDLGIIRKPKNIRKFITMISFDSNTYEVEINNLYKSSNNFEYEIYLHNWKNC